MQDIRIEINPAAPDPAVQQKSARRARYQVFLGVSVASIVLRRTRN